MSDKKLIISIIGTGAVGGYYGIKLSQLGHRVHFLLHSDYDHVKEHGLILQSKVHGGVKLKVNAYNKAYNMPISDVVIIALKTVHNKKVLPEILPYVANEATTVILIQNGLGMEEEIARWFPHLQIAGAIALIGSYRRKGIVVHERNGAINFGSYNLRSTTALDRLIADFNSGGIPSSYQNLKLLRWKKLIWNMAFNGLSVTENCDTDQLLLNHTDRIKVIMQEVISAAKADGAEIPISFAEDFIRLTQKMGSYTPSMRLDYLHTRPLEIEYIYERPIANALEHGVEMPETLALYKKLQEIVTKTKQL